MNEHYAENVSPVLLDYLYGLTLHGIKLGLHNIQQLLGRAGNPHLAYPSIHIGGTNGKGSVAAFLGAMLRAAGYRTGKFTSPHLIDLAERFQINGAPIPIPHLEENLTFFRQATKELGFTPTFFEACTGIAFRWFQQANVEAAVVEVGLGGRLDSTNVLTPLAVGITNIDLEHTQYLGDTLEKIAFEKAGILKPGVPAVTGERRPEVLAVFMEKAREVNCPLAVAGQDFQYAVSGDPWNQRFEYDSPALRLPPTPLALAGRYQADNAAVAVALAERIREQLPRLDNRAIMAGLSSARWPCRMERVIENPPVILDVAHNVAGTRRLAETIEKCVTVLAVASDKDARHMIDTLAPRSQPLILTEFNGKRALPLEELQAAAGSHEHLTFPSLAEAIAHGMKLANAKAPLLITGSIYTAGEARRLLVERYGAPPLSF